MDKLVTGIHKFKNDIFTSQKTLFQRLAKGQTPLALFITCSDSRINPNLLTQTEPGDVFILRNAGNIVPPYGAVFGGEAATIEYAVSVLKVQDIIVCGHSHCGAMAALVDPAGLPESLPAVSHWLRFAETTRRIVMERYGEFSQEERVKKAIAENVLCQIESLHTHPAVAAAVSAERLKLHGWVYRFETGDVLNYDPSKGQFTSMGEELPKTGLRPAAKTLASRQVNASKPSV